MDTKRIVKILVLVAVLVAVSPFLALVSLPVVVTVTK